MVQRAVDDTIATGKAPTITKTANAIMEEFQYFLLIRIFEKLSAEAPHCTPIRIDKVGYHANVDVILSILGYRIGCQLKATMKKHVRQTYPNMQRYSQQLGIFQSLQTHQARIVPCAVLMMRQSHQRHPLVSLVKEPGIFCWRTFATAILNVVGQYRRIPWNVSPEEAVAVASSSPTIVSMSAENTHLTVEQKSPQDPPLLCFDWSDMHTKRSPCHQREYDVVSLLRQTPLGKLLHSSPGGDKRCDFQLKLPHSSVTWRVEQRCVIATKHSGLKVNLTHGTHSGVVYDPANFDALVVIQHNLPSVFSTNQLTLAVSSLASATTVTPLAIAPNHTDDDGDCDCDDDDLTTTPPTFPLVVAAILNIWLIPVAALARVYPQKLPQSINVYTTHGWTRNFHLTGQHSIQAVRNLFRYIFKHQRKVTPRCMRPSTSPFSSPIVSTHHYDAITATNATTMTTNVTMTILNEMDAHTEEKEEYESTFDFTPRPFRPRKRQKKSTIPESVVALACVSPPFKCPPSSITLPCRPHASIAITLVPISTRTRSSTTVRPFHNVNKRVKVC